MVCCRRSSFRLSTFLRKDALRRCNHLLLGDSCPVKPFAWYVVVVTSLSLRLLRRFVILFDFIIERISSSGVSSSIVETDRCCMNIDRKYLPKEEESGGDDGVDDDDGIVCGGELNRNIFRIHSNTRDPNTTHLFQLFLSTGN